MPLHTGPFSPKFNSDGGVMEARVPCPRHHGGTPVGAMEALVALGAAMDAPVASRGVVEVPMLLGGVMEARVPLDGVMEMPTSLGGGTEAHMVPRGIMDAP